MLSLDAPELYYLANFRKALAWLDAHHRDLMDDATWGVSEAVLDVRPGGHSLVVMNRWKITTS